MSTFWKIILLVLILNIVRYTIGGSIEAFTIMEPMHAVMPQFPDVFNNEFDTTDLTISFFYNFMMLLTATWVFHIAHPVLKGNFMAKSFKAFGLMCLFFISLSNYSFNNYKNEQN